VGDAQGPWRLENFVEALDRWETLEHPRDDVRIVVTRWIFSRFDDPYQGVRREPGFGNLWFGPVPGTLTTLGRVVVCAYWILETDHSVRCDSFATLNLPL
jgi:hypothetical protein